MSKSEIIVREENGGIRVKIEANKTSLIAMLVTLMVSIAEDFDEDVDTILDAIKETIYAIDDDEIEEEAPFKSETVRRIMELEKVARPVFDYLVSTYNPHAKIIISSDGVELVEGLMGVPMSKGEEDKVESKACYYRNCRR